MADVRRVRGDKLLLHLQDLTDLDMEVSSASLSHEEADKDLLTFRDAAEGGSFQPKFKITMVQSTDPDSLCMLFWDHSGEIVPFTYAPHGNETPTLAQPHFVGYLEIPGQKPDLGGEAVRKGPGYTTEVECDVTTVDGDKPGKVVKDTGLPPTP